jgi:hypothetical protein
MENFGLCFKFEDLIAAFLSSSQLDSYHEAIEQCRPIENHPTPYRFKMTFEVPIPRKKE